MHIARHAPAPRTKGVAVASTAMKPTIRLMKIQPIVPIILITGKSRPGSATCCIVIELVSAIVGK